MESRMNEMPLPLAAQLGLNTINHHESLLTPTTQALPGDSKTDFQFLRTILQKTKQEAVPGSKLLTYEIAGVR